LVVLYEIMYFCFYVTIGKITSVFSLSALEIMRELSFNFCFIFFIMFYSRLYLVLLFEFWFFINLLRLIATA
jgi:hypothetical protein